MAPVRILLCGDNHGDREILQHLREQYADYDYLIHCGDSEMTPQDMEGFLFVRGNHDQYYDDSVPLRLILEIGAYRIYVCHGHKDFLRYFKYETMLENAAEAGCDTVFFGHVHTYQDTVQKGIRLLNPGSLFHNRDGRHPSYMEIVIDGEDIQVKRVDISSPSRNHGRPGFLERLLNRITGQ